MRQNVIIPPSQKNLPKGLVPEVKRTVKAVYIPTPFGYRLARIQKFSQPTFIPSGYELRGEKKGKCAKKGEGECNDEENLERSLRRAKINAFDLIISNYELDTFCTLTYSPEAVADKQSYDECYEKLKTWLSNGVQRRGLKYVLVPERHKSGAIHFHAICNSGALDLVRATNANTGQELSYNGRPIYNIKNWSYGFSTAEKIAEGAVDREAVSKYIFKYMGKQNGEKVGGRFFLHGGDLVKPFCLYGDSEQEFMADAYGRPTHQTETTPIAGLTYWEWNYI